MSESVFVARLPLFDPARRTTGYELSITDGTDDANRFPDRERTVRRLLGQAVHKIGLDDLVAGREVWVPMTVRLLQDGHHEALPPKRTMLQVDPVAMGDPAMIEELERARRAGYRIALDLTGPGIEIITEPSIATNTADPDTSDADSMATVSSAAEAKANAPARPQQIDLTQFSSMEPLLDAVKLDAATCDDHGFPALVHAARKRMLPIVAVGVNTRSRRSALKLFDFFQGSFVFEPPSEAQPSLVNHIAALELIAELQRPNVSFDDIEKIIGRDPSLALRILTLANSGLFSLPKRVDSTRAALVMLGISNVRHMALMMTLNAVTDVPGELTVATLVRARHCELLASAAKLKKDVAFTVGLLSLAGAFAGLPTVDALAQLPITDEVADAIANFTGPLGVVLRAALACEQNAPDTVEPVPGNPVAMWTAETLASTYIEAIRWAERLRSGTVTASLQSA